MSSSSFPFALSADDKKDVVELIKRSLAEDLHEVGDLTTQATVPPQVRAKGRFLAKADGVVAGIEVGEMVFHQVDPALKPTWTCKDGDYVKKGTYFGEVEGPANSLLIAERLVLNLMQRMSGIATATKKMVDAAGGPHAKTKILDTRKTAPGLRVVDKLAVKIGGGTNHRIGLFDMVMIKDNHVTASGGVKNAITASRKYLTEKNLLGKVQIEVETRTLDEVKEVLEIGGVDRVMLDNMVKVTDDGKVDTSMLSSALALINGKFATEASGNVTLSTVPMIAATGVDYISSGSLTHSVTALDISLKIQLLSAI